jgi:hypothetical protein
MCGCNVAGYRSIVQKLVNLHVGLMAKIRGPGRAIFETGDRNELGELLAIRYKPSSPAFETSFGVSVPVGELNATSFKDCHSV